MINFPLPCLSVCVWCKTERDKGSQENNFCKLCSKKAFLCTSFFFKRHPMTWEITDKPIGASTLKVNLARKVHLAGSGCLVTHCFLLVNQT